MFSLLANCAILENNVFGLHLPVKFVNWKTRTAFLESPHLAASLSLLLEEPGASIWCDAMSASVIIDEINNLTRK